MRDTIGGRPFEVEKVGSEYFFKFYPQAKNAKYPDAITFRLTLSKSEIMELPKLTKKTLGGRPIQIRKLDGKSTITFHPKLKTAKNPNASIFRLIATKDELVKLGKILN